MKSSIPEGKPYDAWTPLPWRVECAESPHLFLGDVHADLDWFVHPDDVELLVDSLQAAQPGQVRARVGKPGLPYRPMLFQALALANPRSGIALDVSLLQSEIESLRIQTELLERQNLALEESNRRVERELESFTYSVSHDLRSPLRTIGGYASLLLTDYADGLDAEIVQMLQRQLEATHRLESLIEALLTYSRIGRAELTKIDVNLSKLALNIGQGLIGQNSDVEVRWEVAPDISVYGDPRLLWTLLESLLDNAIKFSRPKGSADITIGERDGAIYVQDRGIGLDLKYRDRLFLPFERLHSHSEIAGTGMGLATVQKIVRRHGGEVSLASVLGEGCCVTFTLPPRGSEES